MSKVVDKTATCHPDRPYKAKGLCWSCYSQTMHKNNPRKAGCHPDKPHYAKGLCSWCYKKENRKATLQDNTVAKLIDFSYDDYVKNLELQGGTCAICKKPPKSGKRFDIDHEHTTLKFRGLLCNNCNRGIGHLKESISNLQAAINYLTQSVN
jgi:hypothetical protein